MEQSTPDRAPAPDRPAGTSGGGTSVVAPGGASTFGSSSAPGPVARRSVALSALGDVVAVLVFVAVGRRSHAEGLDLGGILATAVPFLGALAVGWVATSAWRAPTAVRTGVLVWLSAVVLGVALRGFGGEGIPVSFVIVTAVVLAVLLVGWRGVLLLLRRRRARA